MSGHFCGQRRESHDACSPYPSVRLPEIILALEIETKKGKLHDKASQRVGDQIECPRPFPGMGLNANIFSPPPTWWTQAPGNQACCMEPDGEGLLPRLGGWGTHCTLGRRLRLAQIRGFLEVAGCLGREVRFRLTVWLCPILSFYPPQPLPKPALRATALPHGCASRGQAQLTLLWEAWRRAVPGLGDTAGGMAAPSPATAGPATNSQVGPQTPACGKGIAPAVTCSPEGQLEFFFKLIN